MDMAFAGIFIIAPLFFISIGLASLVHGVLKYLLYQRICNTPTSKVRSAAIGLVELSGKARADNPLESPISKARCVYWRVSAAYWKGKNKYGSIFTKTSADPFYLEDDTGRMRVEPSGGDTMLPPDNVFQGRISKTNLLGFTLDDRLDERALAYIESDPETRKAIYKHEGKTFRFIETYISEGDPIYVLGRAETREEEDSELPHENLVIRKGPEKILVFGDKGEMLVKGWSFLESMGYLALGAGLIAFGLIFLTLAVFAK
ncbi:MAG: hypothetical protein V1827_06595 [Candidatus Micrarchaeota archaeon]